MFQQCPSKASSTNHQGSSNGTSIFRSLAQKKLSFLFASKSSRSHQRFSKVSSTTNQSNSKRTSTFWWFSQEKVQWSLRFASKPSQCHRRFFKVSSKNHQWRNKETSMFQSLTHSQQKRSKKVSSKLSLFPIYLSKQSSTIIDEAAKKHQCFGDYHNKKIFIINVCIKIIKVLATSLQRIINSNWSIKQQWNIRNWNTAH